jgi:fatty-acid desaturase
VYPIIPAILGLWLYFYLDGTIEKFIILFFLCRLLNILWVSINHKWLCHHQFEPKKWARPILLFFIVIGGFKRNDPTGFIKAHTAHHKDKDTVFDPYPPTWGFWNNALLGFRYYQTYPFGRWMVAPDIKFVFRNLMWLRIFYWTVIGLIDIHVFLLSFVFMEVYVRITGGIESFLYHDGFGTKQPVDRYAYLGYPIMLFLGESWIHGSHHDRPWVFNNGKENPKLIDIEYQLLRVFADTKQNK